MDFNTERVPIDDLRPHPENYRDHPPDQIEHIISSITNLGFYRNVVIANDNTILAGHGVWKACKQMGTIKEIPCIRLKVSPDSASAKKVLVGDNEIGKLGLQDDRMLTTILREIYEADDLVDGLLGTGYDEMMLAGLVYVTRPADEIQDVDEAA